MAPPRVAIATCAILPEDDPDEGPLLRALAREGAAVSLLAWDGPDPVPAAGELDLVLVRSTWNYAKSFEKFVEWLERVGAVAALRNPVAVLKENVDKGYLRTLAARGIATVPTAFVDAGAAVTLAEVAREHGLSDVVVKPRVSAGSWKTARFEASRFAEGEAFFAELVAERDVLVQPYLASVEGRGERSIVVLDGVVSHAIRKSPRFASDTERVSRVPIDDDERAFAERVLAPYRDLLYARVDVARDGQGELVLMELELLEPSLFFREAPEALPAFARAVVREAKR